MKNTRVLLLLVAIVALLASGCGATPTPKPAVTQAPQVITVVVVVTATPPPATETPLPTATSALTTTALITPTTVASLPTKASTSGTARPTATKKPTTVAAAPTATPLRLKYGAPYLITPLWQPPLNEQQKDERKFPADSLEFVWKSVGPLAGDECYLLNVTAEPANPGPGVGPASDYFLATSSTLTCGDQSIPDTLLKFTLYSPRVGGPNYDSIMINTNEMWVNWSITVVKNLGQCEPKNSYHCKTAPLSPPGKGKFLFKGV